MTRASRWMSRLALRGACLDRTPSSGPWVSRGSIRVPRWRLRSTTSRFGSDLGVVQDIRAELAQALHRPQDLLHVVMDLGVDAVWAPSIWNLDRPRRGRS